MKHHSFGFASTALWALAAASQDKYITKDTEYDGSNNPLPQLGRLDIAPDVYYSVFNTDINIDDELQNQGKLYLTSEYGDDVLSSTNAVFNKGMISISAPKDSSTVFDVQNAAFDNSGSIFVKADMVTHSNIVSIIGNPYVNNLGLMSFENTNQDQASMELSAKFWLPMINTGTIYLKNILWDQSSKTDGSGCIVLGDDARVAISAANDKGQDYYLASGSSTLQLKGIREEEYRVQGFGNGNRIIFPDAVSCNYDTETGYLSCGETDLPPFEVTYMKRDYFDVYSIFIGTGYDPAKFSEFDRAYEIYYNGEPQRGPSGHCYIPGSAPSAPKVSVTSSLTSLTKSTRDDWNETTIPRTTSTSSLSSSSSRSNSSFASSSASSLITSSSSFSTLSSISSSVANSTSRSTLSSTSTHSSKSPGSSASILSSTLMTLRISSVVPSFPKSSSLAMDVTKSSNKSSASVSRANLLTTSSHSTIGSKSTIASSSSHQGPSTSGSSSQITSAIYSSSSTHTRYVGTSYLNLTSSATKSSSSLVSSNIQYLSSNTPKSRNEIMSSSRVSGVSCVDGICSSQPIKTVDFTTTTSLTVTSCSGGLCDGRMQLSQVTSNFATTTMMTITSCSEAECSPVQTPAATEKTTTTTMVTVTKCSDDRCSAVTSPAIMSVVTITKDLTSFALTTYCSLTTITEEARKSAEVQKSTYTQGNNNQYSPVSTGILSSTAFSETTNNSISIANYGATVGFSMLSLVLSFMLSL